MSSDLHKAARDVYLKSRWVLLSPLFLFRRIKSIPEEGFKRILFLRHDRIGDMVVSTAAIKALKIAYPQAMITVLASAKNHEVLKGNPYVDEVIIFRGLINFIQEIRPRGFDLAIDLFLTYELKQAWLAYLSGARYRIGFAGGGREIFFNLSSPNPSSNKKMAEHLLDIVERVGVASRGCKPEIFLTKEEVNQGKEAFARMGIGEGDLKIAIHPGAHYPSQRWSGRKFGEVAKRIGENFKAKIILLGAREEKNIVAEVKEVAEGKVADLSGVPLRTLMAIVKGCDLLLCNNSGPLHIAAALGVPTVSMVGPSETPLWLPYGDGHVVLQKDLPCRPCHRAYCDGHECMEAITVEEVLAAVRTQIETIRREKFEEDPRR